jgi:hypothetical protein
MAILTLLVSADTFKVSIHCTHYTPHTMPSRVDTILRIARWRSQVPASWVPEERTWDDRLLCGEIIIPGLTMHHQSRPHSSIPPPLLNPTLTP